MDYFDINTLRNQIITQSKKYNRFKTDNYSLLQECIIKDINIKKMTVTVFIPSTSSKLYNVLIGTNIIGSKTFIKSMPSIGDRGIVALSSNQPAILTSMIPDILTDNDLMEGELKLGNKDLFFKIYQSDSAIIKTSKSFFSFDDGIHTEMVNEKKITGNGVDIHYNTNKNNEFMGYEKELYFESQQKDYQKTKDYFLKDNLINEEKSKETILQNHELLNKLNELVEVSSNTSIDLGKDDANQKLLEFKNKIMNFVSEGFVRSLTIEKGDSPDNIKDSKVFLISYKENMEEKSSISFYKNGTIKIKCKDFIIEKEDSND